jgi:hypothetical protein
MDKNRPGVTRLAFFSFSLNAVRIRKRALVE